MEYKKLEEVVEELKGAVKAHGNQAKVVEDHIKHMKKKEYGGPVHNQMGVRVPGMYKNN
jgi:hypothetical protein